MEVLQMHFWKKIEKTTQAVKSTPYMNEVK